MDLKQSLVFSPPLKRQPYLYKSHINPVVFDRLQRFSVVSSIIHWTEQMPFMKLRRTAERAVVTPSAPLIDESFISADVGNGWAAG
jgi:hypothetical protein